MARYAPDYYRVREAARVTRQVPVRTLDGFGPFEGPVLLKLDVEGYEGHVLRGAREMLRADVVHGVGLLGGGAAEERGAVDDGVDAAHRRVEGGWIEEVAFDEFDRVAE